MFNSNIPASSLLSIEGSGLLMGGHTPKTPEILNSLIAMTNPLDNFNFGSAAAAVSATLSASSSATSTPVVAVRHFNGHPNGQSHSQDSSHSSCSGSPLESPAGTATTPSVQQTCSRLIKEGLKLSIQSKRKLSTCDSSSGSEQPHSKYSRRSSSNHNGHNSGGSSSNNNYSGSMSNANDLDDLDCEESSDEDDSETKSQPKGLTPEDEDRRRRRRERNKIAATKCRMKKRERTQNLIKESEVLDTQNVELKQQVRLLETERRNILDMLQSHGCQRSSGCQLPSQLLQSPAQKYLSELELETVVVGGEMANSGNANSHQRLQSIPSMATFKFGSKTAAAMAQQQQLPTGYCKPSPSAQEFEHAGYQQQPQQHQQQQQQSLNPAGNNNNNVVDQQQQQVNSSPSLISDYVPNCDGLSSSNLSNPSHNSSNMSSNNNTSSSSNNNNTSSSNNNTSSHTSNNRNTSTTPTAIEFVKHELVDSQSPYTTALSAERFLFEPSDGFPDIKHACVLPSPCGINGINMASVVHTNGNGSNGNNHNNNNNNNHLMDFHSGLQHGNNVGVGVGVGVMTPYDDEQLLLLKNGCFATDLLSQLVEDGGEYVDLDSATAFMNNGSCLA
ncbi:activating transcription factor 3 [Drosophila gunungcola]|uniref:activating transcription factor 3 n=1 Tax=Drosophila gunungcola TaxID=103775 RepID=UPI0022E271B2|nr:activating transcription factor 3 [Drosophila gunungcola]